MAEYIEREAFRKMLVDRQITTNFFRPLERHEDGCIIEMLDETPAADVAPVVHGRWKVKCESHQCFVSGEYDEDYYIECSECGRKVWDISQDAAVLGNWEKISKQYPYCHCGAKMDVTDINVGDKEE